MLGLIVLLCIAGASGFGWSGSITRRSQAAQQVVQAPQRVVASSSGARSMTMMPIGIPKVAYKMPGSRGGEWVDIYQRLTRERIIFMGSEIDDEMANQIIGVLLVRRLVCVFLCVLYNTICTHNLMSPILLALRNI